MKLPHFAVSHVLVPDRRRLARIACAIAAILPIHAFAANATAKELTPAQTAFDQLPPSATLRKIAENGSIVLAS